MPPRKPHDSSASIRFFLLSSLYGKFYHHFWRPKGPDGGKAAGKSLLVADKSIAPLFIAAWKGDCTQVKAPCTTVRR